MPNVPSGTLHNAYASANFKFSFKNFFNVWRQAGIPTTGGGAATGTRQSAPALAMREPPVLVDTPWTQTARDATFSGQVF